MSGEDGGRLKREIAVTTSLYEWHFGVLDDIEHVDADVAEEMLDQGHW